MLRHRIVVGTDGSEHARHALRWALEEAQLRNARLTVVQAWSPPGPMSSIGPMTAPIDLSDWAQAAKGGLEDDITDALTTTATTDVDVEPLVVEGYAPSVLLEQAADADLLVVGSRGRGGFKGLLLGSVSRHLAAHSDVPVAVVRFESSLPDDRDVVVGVDGSPGSAAALQFAVLEAARRHARLVVAHGWWVDSLSSTKDALPFITFDRSEFVARSRELMHRMVDAAAQALGLESIDAEILPLEDSPTHALVSLTVGAGLLVVGTRGRGGLKGLLLGSVSQQCCEHAHSAVVIVPTPRTDTSHVQ